jgi:hypothetical protein
MRAGRAVQFIDVALSAKAVGFNSGRLSGVGQGARAYYGCAASSRIGGHILGRHWLQREIRFATG